MDFPLVFSPSILHFCVLGDSLGVPGNSFGVLGDSFGVLGDPSSLSHTVTNAMHAIEEKQKTSFQWVALGVELHS